LKLCSGGNFPNAQPTTPFTLSDSSSGTIYVNGPLDIYNNPVYYLTVAAYNSSLATVATLQNASLIAVHVIVDDVDNHGPTFDNTPLPSVNCAGIGKVVNRGETVTLVFIVSFISELSVA